MNKEEENIECHWDHKPCDKNTPCVTWNTNRTGCVVCMRYKGDLENDESSFYGEAI